MMAGKKPNKEEMKKFVERNLVRYEGNLAHCRGKSACGAKNEEGHLDAIKTVMDIIDEVEDHEEIAMRVEELKLTTESINPHDGSPDSFYCSGVCGITDEFLDWLKN
jgi:hypothetical protein